MISEHSRYALAHPVFDPDRDGSLAFFWNFDSRIIAGLTVNIGIE
jgi:hypothetical protein